jgi:probable addiction module antidote protein
MKIPKGFAVLDIADHLITEQDIAYFLEAACADNDPEHIAHALGIVARARGMTKIAKKTGLSRATLYNALSENGNPEFATILKVINALGLKLKVV